MADLIGRTASFRDAIAIHERIVLSRQLPVVEKGIEWLMHSQQPGGYWGVEDVAETSLCCLAISRWRPEEASNLLSDSAEWLCGQATDGEWDTHWDSGVALQALISLDRGGASVVLRGLDRLRSIDPSDDREWASHPHHAAQVLTALHASGAGADLLHAWSRCITRHLPVQEDIYVLSQGVRAVLVSGTVAPAELPEQIDLLVDYLGRQGRPSESELRSFAPAVEALSFTPGNEALVHQKAATIAGAWSDKRAWYKSPRHAAVSLLALHGAGSACEIALDKPTFNAQFGYAFDELPLELARERRNATLLGGALVALLVAGGLVIALWDETKSVFVSGAILSSLAVAIPAVIREIWKGLKPLLRKN